ncbi:MAG TPA: glycine cleavage system protein GcvH [Planctomycetota bacterium]|nr:glycine cleavage system protein GcvH [Planctomycetota bacterium]
MTRPRDRKYLETHEWARKDGDAIVVGITDHAVSELGELVFCAIKAKAGDRVTKGEPFGEIESVKAVSDLNSPVNGTIVEVNGGIADALDLVAQDPFNAGWMIRVKPAADSGFEKLLDADAYEKHVASAH